MKPWFSFTLLALTSGVLSASTGARLASISLRARDASIRIADSVMNTPAYDLFRSPDTRTVFRTTKEEAGMVKRKYSRHSQKLETEEQLRKRIALDGGYVYLLQCTDAGFRGDCLVFGSKPGSCGTFCVVKCRVLAKYLCSVLLRLQWKQNSKRLDAVNFRYL